MLPASVIFIQTPVSTEWFHLVLNYLGPVEGISVYHNGEKLMIDENIFPTTHSAGPGVVVIGRYSTFEDDRYSSVVMDELTFFNRKLTNEEIGILNSVQN